MSARRRTRSRSYRAATVVLGLVAATGLLGGAAVGAQESDEPVLGIFQGTAHASGVHFYFTPEGILPVGAIVDSGAPDALATVASGPSTFARAALADPGDLLANPDAILTQGDPSYPQGTIPPWPFRAETNSGFGEPHAEMSPAPGLEATSTSTPEGSQARASTPAAAQEGLGSVRSMSSTATTTFEGPTVSVQARTEVSGVDLLDMITIESVVSDVVATSDGTTTDLQGNTVITGAAFMGQPITIDGEGVHLDETGPAVPGLGDLTEQLPEDLGAALEEAGIHITVGGPLEQEDGSTSQLGSTGLRIDLELDGDTVPLLTELADSLPPPPELVPGLPGIEDALVLAQATYVSAIDVGRAEVALMASPPIVIPPYEPIDLTSTTAPAPVNGSSGVVPPPPTTAPTATSPPTTAPLVTTAPSAGAAPSTGAGPAEFAAPAAPKPRPTQRPPAAPTPAVGTRPTVTGTPIASLSIGIGTLALLALILQPFIGDRLGRAATSALVADGADICPREAQP